MSKLKNTLDNATKANQRKFKARYKQTNKKFLKEVQMIVQLAKLEMEEQKNASKRGPKKMVQDNSGKQSAYLAMHKL